MLLNQKGRSHYLDGLRLDGLRRRWPSWYWRQRGASSSELLLVAATVVAERVAAAAGLVAAAGPVAAAECRHAGAAGGRALGERVFDSWRQSSRQERDDLRRSRVRQGRKYAPTCDRIREAGLGLGSLSG